MFGASWQSWISFRNPTYFNSFWIHRETPNFAFLLLKSILFGKAYIVFIVLKKQISKIHSNLQDPAFASVVNRNFSKRFSLELASLSSKAKCRAWIKRIKQCIHLWNQFCCWFCWWRNIFSFNTSPHIYERTKKKYVWNALKMERGYGAKTCHAGMSNEYRLW